MPEKVNPNSVLAMNSDGKLEIPGHTNVLLSGSTRTELRLDPTPITFKIETATDWAAVSATALVGVAGIFTALVVGWLTHKSAKQAAAATAAEIRSKWMQDLRNEAADFYAAVIELSFIVSGEGFELTNGNDVKFSKMQKHRAVITMMLDTEKQGVKKLIEIMDETSKAVLRGEYSNTTNALNKFKAQVTALLEAAWQDIKDDLYGVKKKNNANAT
jgi:F0F1-type ATP synthase membrane subunit c/vacuolar-type H+-ATPase subunit K